MVVSKTKIAGSGQTKWSVDLFNQVECNLDTGRRNQSPDLSLCINENATPQITARMVA